MIFFGDLRSANKQMTNGRQDFFHPRESNAVIDSSEPPRAAVTAQVFFNNDECVCSAQDFYIILRKKNTPSQDRDGDLERVRLTS